MNLSFEEFEKASKTLSKIIQPTPMIFNEWLSKQYQCKVYLKMENMLPIGSFKMRGATYKLSTLSKKELKQGVMAVSAGNHAQGVAWAARYYKTKAHIIMPSSSPLTKINNTESLGAKVFLDGNNIEDCFKLADKLVKKHHYHFVHPYEDEAVIAGQGSVAFEMISQCKNMDYVFSAIGGGGLVTGMGSVLQRLSPRTKLIAGQASGANFMVESIRKNKIQKGLKALTFADGIRVKHVSPVMFKKLKSLLHDVCHVSDEKLSWAVLQLIEKARIVAEGAGALPLAIFDELYHQNPKKYHGKNIVLVVCGGNIDVNILARIIDRGLIESNRKIRLHIRLSDLPGALHQLTGLIRDTGANILQVTHQRDSQKLGLTGTEVQLVLETKGKEHRDLLIKTLKPHYDDLKLLT